MADINFLGTISLGKITKWENVKESELTIVPNPGRDSAFTKAVDTLGVVKTFLFEGRLTGDFDTIQNTIYLIESKIDGHQTSSTTLYSPFVAGRDDVARRQGSISMSTSASTNTLSDNTALFSTCGIQVGDRVKNLISGATAMVTDVTSEHILGLGPVEIGGEANIFPSFPLPYAVTAHINVKLMKFQAKWGLPGLSFCDYQLTVLQVV